MRARAAAAVFAAGGKIVFLADLASLCLCIEYRTLFSEKREFARLRSCRYSRKRFEMSFLKVSLMYDVCMLTCRFTFICRFFGPRKGLPFNTLENYGMAS